MSTHGMTGSVSSNERGTNLLERSALNKGTAFTNAERAAFGLKGLLPPSVETIDQQQRRILQQLGQKPTDLERYIYMIQLFDSNETLFYYAYADMIVSAMKLEGLTEEQGRGRIWMFNTNGLLENTRKDLHPEQKVYAHKHAPTHDLLILL